MQEIINLQFIVQGQVYEDATTIQTVAGTFFPNDGTAIPTLWRRRNQGERVLVW